MSVWLLFVIRSIILTSLLGEKGRNMQDKNRLIIEKKTTEELDFLKLLSAEILYFSLSPFFDKRINGCIFPSMSDQLALWIMPLFNSEFSTFQVLLAMYAADSHNCPTTSPKIPSCKLQEFLKIPSKLPENPGFIFFWFFRNCTKMSAKDDFFWGIFLRTFSQGKTCATCLSIDHFWKRFQKSISCVKGCFWKTTFLKMLP